MRRTIITTVIASATVAGATFLAPAAQASSGHSGNAQTCFAYYNYIAGNYTVYTDNGKQQKQYTTDRPPASCYVI
jgi:hypothetical protein